VIGSTLAHYRILEKLGSGGMGDVYLAIDTRLDRKVALKVLSAETARDDRRRQRFEGEAKAIASLDHPNIVHAYSVEEADGVHFITMQLVRGKTLRSLIPRGGLPLSQFFDIAIPLTHAVAAAHQEGITHRDLKPDNVMVTDEGRVKVLDFGLAQLVESPGLGAVSEAPTVSRLTAAGVVVGTVGHMAPEQVRGQAVGPGADVFALGILAHEMLSGLAPFRRDSAPETLTATLNDDPPGLPSSVPPALERVVRRCLEKSPRDRFHSAHDLGLALEALSIGGEPASRASHAPSAPGVSRRQLLVAGGGAAVGLAGLGAGAFVSRRRPAATSPSYRRLTFRRGMIRTARFGPDYQTILYGALWDGDICRVYSVRPDSPESARLDLPAATPLAVSPGGELALSLGDQFRGVMPYGTLARVPLVGGAPRELLEDVKYADWSPDGSELAVVRRVGGREQLEFPVGHVVAERSSVAGAGFSFPRVSPKGDRVAFFELTATLVGRLVVADWRTGRRFVSRQYANVFGLAWKGDEIWFTAADERPLSRDAIVAITAAETERVVARVPGNASLHDISPAGTILMAHTDDRCGIAVLAPGDAAERDLSWFDSSFLADISRDGSRILFTEGGVGGGPRGSVCLRSTTGSPAVRLGDGSAIALSPDGQWAVAKEFGGPSRHVDLLPTGAGQARRIELPGFEFFEARWLPDGQRLIVQAQEGGGGGRLYRLDTDGGAPDAVTPEGVRVAASWALSPDGRWVAVASGHGVDVHPVSGGEVRAVPGPTVQLRLLAWIEGGLLVTEDPNWGVLDRVFLLDPVTGGRRIWKDIRPRDPAGIMSMGWFKVTPDGRFYGYTWARATSNLYLVDGMS
jgi:hypothetical protein